MLLNEPLVEELLHEAAGTRKMLEMIPYEKLGWQPHEKSMTLGRLGAHIAEIAGWLVQTIKQDELDFASEYAAPQPLEERDAIMKAFDENMQNGVAALSEATDENLTGAWTLRNGEEIYLRMQRIGVVRGLVLNHIVHHRGQLSVYLRLLDIPVPGMYGPSADDMMG
ncbi:MAG: DinB family protein [Chitinophagaceae bacterium]|nr:DinB family protein [Chitinophagaceae bacterium]